MKMTLYRKTLSTPVVVLIVVLFLGGSANSANAVSITWVDVGDSGNVADVATIGGNNFGSVAYDYRISKYVVTNSQYVEFLDIHATIGDPLALYSASMTSNVKGGIVRTGSGTVGDPWNYAVKPSVPGQAPGGADYHYTDKPAVFVSWFNSVRFANWMHNGQGSGDTETGAYTLLGGTPVPSNATTITREPGAEIFLPDVDEWYKAAYYDPDKAGGAGYWDFPTRSDTEPDNNIPSADSGNSANWGGAGSPGKSNYPLTDVGAYPLSESAYGTADQAGLVYEWNETLRGTSQRRFWGGGWNEAGSVHMEAEDDTHYDTGDRERGNLGFRLATLAVSCIVGDANCDGYVDIASDILPAFSNFTGPGSFSKTRAEGDVEGTPQGATSNLDPHDGDVDVSDIITMFGNFTGPPPDESGDGGLAAAEVGDPSIPDLIYDAATGEVTLDVDGSGIIGYVLKNGAGTFVPGNHTPILGGVTTSLAGELSEAALSSPGGANSIGFVFPTGMNLAALGAYLTTNEVSRSLGAPIVPFDLVVLNAGPAVPEPATLLLSAISLVGVGLVARRRRAA